MACHNLVWFRHLLQAKFAQCRQGSWVESSCRDRGTYMIDETCGFLAPLLEVLKPDE